MLTEEEFIERTGRAPEDDDLERVNCELAGQAGHWACGWCDAHNGPQFECGCGVLIGLNAKPREGE